MCDSSKSAADAIFNYILGSADCHVLFYIHRWDLLLHASLLLSWQRRIFMDVIDVGFHRLTLFTKRPVGGLNAVRVFPRRLASQCGLPPLSWETAKLRGLICIFVRDSKVFNESWQRPVW